MSRLWGSRIAGRATQTGGGSGRWSSPGVRAPGDAAQLLPCLSGPILPPVRAKITVKGGLFQNKRRNTVNA